MVLALCTLQKKIADVKRVQSLSHKKLHFQIFQQKQCRQELHPTHFFAKFKLKNIIFYNFKISNWKLSKIW